MKSIPIHAVFVNHLELINNKVQPVLKPGKILGIMIDEKDLSDNLYNITAEVDIAFVLVVNKSKEEIEKEVKCNEIPLAEKIVHILLHPAQYQFSSRKVLLVYCPAFDIQSVFSWNELLLKNLMELGIKNVAVFNSTTEPLNRDVKFKYYNKGETEQDLTFVDLLFPHVANNTINWATNYKYATISPVDLELQQLKERNEELEKSNNILIENINDLNKYYRLIRGEKIIRQQNGELKYVANNLMSGYIELNKLLEKFGAPNLDGRARYTDYYNEIYERLPYCYKKIGSLLKIILCRREPWHHTSKRHRKIFLSVIHSLPNEMQTKIRYYYKYEILPEWYKRLGHLLRK